MGVKFYIVEVYDYSGHLGYEVFRYKERALEYIQENSDGSTFFELYEAHHIDR